jgi:hypothetical protein
MDSNTRPRRGAALLLFLIAGLFSGGAWAHAINGAIYTSLPGGTTVNANNYDSKDLVYLNGGPMNANCNAGALDDGEYYFQVTNPSGSMLLSSDVIDERRFRVTGGVISDYLGGTHLTALNSTPCGGISIQLIPYLDTPNNGGVYKVWVTRVTDFDEQGGFVGGHIKTDNFRVQDPDEPPPPPQTGALEAYKFYDANANGAYDVGETELPNWEMTLTSVNQVVNSTKVTLADGTATWILLEPDSDYHVTEGTPVQGNWVHSTTIYIGHDGSPQNPAGPLTVLANQTTTVGFGNYCIVPSGGRTLGFWSNKVGRARMNSAGMAGLLGSLAALNLRNAAGGDFDPATYDAFREWLLAAHATNMAYMLSAQLAAMHLNVQAGWVNGASLYAPAGMTIQQIMNAANTSLGLYGYTPSGHAQRTNQEQLKNWLDALNNGAPVVSPTPCAYTFP